MAFSPPSMVEYNWMDFVRGRKNNRTRKIVAYVLDDE